MFSRIHLSYGKLWSLSAKLIEWISDEWFEFKEGNSHKNFRISQLSCPMMTMMTCKKISTIFKILSSLLIRSLHHHFSLFNWTFFVVFFSAAWNGIIYAYQSENFNRISVAQKQRLFAREKGRQLFFEDRRHSLEYNSQHQLETSNHRRSSSPPSTTKTFCCSLQREKLLNYWSLLNIAQFLHYSR